MIVASFALVLAVTLSGVQTLNSTSQPMRATLDATALQSPLHQQLTLHEYGGGAAAPVLFYDRDMTKYLHLIAVDDRLQTFLHVHPVLQRDGAFKLALTFPHGGMWHLYADGFPHNFGRQVFRFDLQLPGSVPPPEMRRSSRTAHVGPYTVAIDPASLPAGKMSMLTVHIEKNGKPATDLLPYLGARAHAVVIGTDLSYIHAHAMSGTMPMSGMSSMLMPMPATSPKVIPSEDPCNQDAEVGMSMIELPPTTHVGATMSIMLQPAKPGRDFLWIQFRGGGIVYAAPFVLEAR